MHTFLRHFSSSSSSFYYHYPFLRVDEGRDRLVLSQSNDVYILITAQSQTLLFRHSANCRRVNKTNKILFFSLLLILYFILLYYRASLHHYVITYSSQLAGITALKYNNKNNNIPRVRLSSIRL